MTTITGSTGGSGTKAISKKYPAEDGLTGATTSQTGHKEQLEPQDSSNITKIQRQGIR